MQIYRYRTNPPKIESKQCIKCFEKYRWRSESCIWMRKISVNRGYEVEIYAVITARLIRFFWADTDDFQFSLPISDNDIFVLLKQYLFCLMRQNNHSWSYFAFSQTFSNYSWKTLQCIFFFGPHKENNFSSYNYFMRQDIHSCYALWGKIYTPGASLPPAEHDWLNWSHDKFGQHDCLNWLWHL